MNPAYCSSCGQALPQRKGRICSECGDPIKQHDRWHFVGSRVQHRDCNDPQLAKQAAEIRANRQATLEGEQARR